MRLKHKNKYIDVEYKYGILIGKEKGEKGTYLIDPETYATFAWMFGGSIKDAAKLFTSLQWNKEKTTQIVQEKIGVDIRYKVVYGYGDVEYHIWKYTARDDTMTYEMNLRQVWE
jgi:hypothetical protein